MPATLLRPHFLAYKNRLFTRPTRGIVNREIVVLIISMLMMVAIFYSTRTFIEQVISHPSYSPQLISKLISLTLYTFFVLLIFSNTVVALGSLYNSFDLPLLLTFPISNLRFYLLKLFDIVLTSSWMFLLFGLPAGIAFTLAMSLSSSFLLTLLLLSIPLVFIPAALGIIIVTILVNIVPPQRMKETLVFIAFIFSISLLIVSPRSPSIPTDEQKLDDLVSFLAKPDETQPSWLPSKWIADILVSHFDHSQPVNITTQILLVSSTIGIIACAFLVFNQLFHRGLAYSTANGGPGRVYGSDFGEYLGTVIIPFHPQFRAILYKEARMFIRDTTQALQLLMLLLLTFMYLYNFRTLQLGSHLSSEGLVWWQVILGLANLCFGSCVVSAIATRFVFPAVSLEGGAYMLMRSSPLSIEQLLRFKFYIWFLPIALLSCVLLVSGTMAIQNSPQTIFATAVLSILFSISIVGLGIGTGAVFAKFDWDSPTQITASFGSLVFMLLCLCVISISLIPAAFVLILTGVSDFANRLSPLHYWLVLSFSTCLVFFINYFSAKKAMAAGANALRELER